MLANSVSLNLNRIFLLIALMTITLHRLLLLCCTNTTLRYSTPLTDSLNHYPMHKSHGNCTATATKNKYAINFRIIKYLLSWRYEKKLKVLSLYLSRQKDHWAHFNQLIPFFYCSLTQCAYSQLLQNSFSHITDHLPVCTKQTQY